MGSVKALGTCGLRFPFSRLGPGLVGAGACRTSTVLTVARGYAGAGLRSALGAEASKEGVLGKLLARQVRRERFL